VGASDDDTAISNRATPKSRTAELARAHAGRVANAGNVSDAAGGGGLTFCRRRCLQKRKTVGGEMGTP
jgi:hypothetical protein